MSRASAVMTVNLDSLYDPGRVGAAAGDRRTFRPAAPSMTSTGR